MNLPEYLETSFPHREFRPNPSASTLAANQRFKLTPLSGDVGKVLDMLLIIIRALFILTVAGFGVQLVKVVSAEKLGSGYFAFIVVMVLAVTVLAADQLTPRKRIQTISALFFGLLVGVILSDLIRNAFEPMMLMFINDNVWKGFYPVLIAFVCYFCVSTLLQTKDDFRFIIPYMEFSKEVKGSRPLVLDTSVVIDGRIADVAETHVLDQPLVVPRFVLQELQGIADSSDKLRRNRGRRGLDILNRLQKSPGIEVRIHDSEIPELAGIKEVDQKLVVLAKHLGGKVVTNDYNLNKIARRRTRTGCRVRGRPQCIPPRWCAGRRKPSGRAGFPLWLGRRQSVSSSPRQTGPQTHHRFAAR